MRCLYCDRDKAEITGEHVIPRSIGGNLKDTNPFELKEVCSECNNACGRYVDGPFIRGPFTHQAKVTTSVRAFNRGITESLPLNFMGQAEDLNFGSRICELWLGPTGDRIYHFHDPYPLGQDSPAVVGRPTYLREDQVDPGFVFLFVRSNNPVWWPVIFKSVVQQFPGGQLFLGSIPAKVEALAPFTEALRGFSPLRADLGDLYQKLKALNGVQHQTTGRVSIDYGSRFLAKLSLGLGGLFLDTPFRSSESADLLRKFLWTRKLEDRQKIPFRGRNFISDPDPNFARMAEFLSWPGGHLVMMLPRGRFFMMYAKFFDGQSATGLISNEPEHWRNVNKEGMVFIISPGLRKCVGPITLTAFILHKTGRLIASSISELEDEEKVSPLPPFDLPDEAK